MAVSARGQVDIGGHHALGRYGWRLPSWRSATRARTSPADPGRIQHAGGHVEQLVADIRAYHLFPDAWPMERWAAELSALEREVTAAVDRSALFVALSHVAASLRDGHLAFTPAGGSINPGIAVLPVSFFNGQRAWSRDSSSKRRLADVGVESATARRSRLGSRAGARPRVWGASRPAHLASKRAGRRRIRASWDRR